MCVLAVLLVSIVCKAQHLKYVVRFTDKKNTPYRIQKPLDYLSERAVHRRTKFHIKIDSSDLPVAPRYIARVLHTGDVKLLSTSKWLNAILIECKSASTLANIEALPFVISTSQVRKNGVTTGRFYKEKLDEDVTEITNHSARQTTSESVLQYGDAYEQVHMHNGEFLHDKGYTGNGMMIAVLDAGFNKYNTMPAFDSLRLNHKIVSVKDFVDYDNSVAEDGTHGRYCLSTMAANWPGKMVGTAPTASYILLRTEDEASEYPVEEFNWVVGAEYADSCGADMISSSLGYTEFDNPDYNHNYSDFYKNRTMISKGASAACNKGMIVMSSAGNEGYSSWKYLSFPADVDSVCTVGAVDKREVVAGFSSYGYGKKIKPDIVSLGVNTVIAGIDAPLTGSGTSYANPNVAGLIACLWQAFPDVKNMDVLHAVYESANHFETPDARYGYGVPDMRKAYRILKHQQNVKLYGNEWFIVLSNPFTNTITIKLVGKVDGKIKIRLTDAGGFTLAAKDVVTEQEEIANVQLEGLNYLPAGNYYLDYKDSLEYKKIMITKQANVLNDWLSCSPVPFAENLRVYLKAPATGKAVVRLLNMSGITVASKDLAEIKGELYVLTFSQMQTLPKGVYFIQYNSETAQKTIKVLKQ